MKKTMMTAVAAVAAAALAELVPVRMGSNDTVRAAMYAAPARVAGMVCWGAAANSTNRVWQILADGYSNVVAVCCTGSDGVAQCMTNSLVAPDSLLKNDSAATNTVVILER